MVRVRNRLNGPIAIHNRRMVNGEYESMDDNEMFSFLLAAGADEWVPASLIESDAFRLAFTKKMIVVVTFEMLQGRFRFLNVKDEIGE